MCSIALDPNPFLLHLYLLSLLCRPSRSEFILSPSPLCGVSGTEVIPHSSESKHSPLWAFKLCLFSKLCMYVSAAVVTPTPRPLPTPPSTISHSWPISSLLHGKIPQRWRKEGGPPIRSSISLSHTFSAPSPSKYLSHCLHQPKLCSQPISSCGLDIGKVGSLSDGGG